MTRHLITTAILTTASAFTPALHPSRTSPSSSSSRLGSTLNAAGNLHGQEACFLPLLQNDDEYIAPRIVQIAGAYPGVDIQTYLALTSEPPAEMGQWSYDFSDPNGPQMGTVALPGMASVYETEDPVAIIAENTAIGVSIPNMNEVVDLIVLCDRARTHWQERKFLVLDMEGNGMGDLKIAAFVNKSEVPANAKILGHVTLVQIPWLPGMAKKKSGFAEEDELF
ncbi:hypothetical protein ACHAXN_011957 [Cyclotella atomus]